MNKIIEYVKRCTSRNGGVFRPIVITDIDGVLLRGTTQIPGTLEALQSLKQHNIPLACLTNGGGQLESYKVQKMNAIFGQQIFTPSLMFMNHSPVRPHLSKYSQQQGLILISGSLKVTDIIDQMGIRNYVTADELYAIFHKGEIEQKTRNGLSFHIRNINSEQVVQRIRQRLKISTLPANYHQWGQKINSIFALNDVSPYQTTLQVIHNVFSEKTKRNIPLPPYFAAQNDIVWAGGYHRPRLAFGPFNYMLEQHCQRHSFSLNKCYFGKPEKIAFEFVEKYMREQFGEGCFFMVGDNPRADIKGANSVNWASFLTKTGVHQGNQNDELNPATMVVQNFKQAIQCLMKIEKDSLYV